MTAPDLKADLYKDTVFLPKTDFPMRGELPQKEPAILKRWQEMDLYAQIRKASQGREKWVLHWGPPYANGRAHVGHAFTKSLKDIVNRSKQMAGYDAPLVPGWDCHGLPIEWKIEEKYRNQGLNKDDVPVLQFRQECREFAQEWADIQSDDFQRFGVLADWKSPYMTMHKKSEADIAREIHKFLLNGLLYKGVKPVMWSVVEKTALAEAEVEYKEHKSITIWVKFPVVSTRHKQAEGASIVIWTTTPWTMPSNRAVAFGADIEYAVYTINTVEEGSRAASGDRIILAVKLADDVMKAGKVSDYSQGDVFKGSALEGSVLAHPLRGYDYDYDVPILEGDFVTDDAGTGFVHIAPSHGEDDYFLYVKHFGGRDIPDNVTDDGKMREHVPNFAGLSIYNEKGEMGDVNFAVLKALDAAKTLLHKGSLKHEYPHSWRSKAPLIFRTTPQWFIAMDEKSGGATLREKALQGIKNTKWFPAAGENRITAMIAGRPDWCISRQRAWGVPIALFVSKRDGGVLKDEAVLKTIGDIFEKEGSDAWYARPAQDFLGNQYKAEDYDQVFDVVDVWFESGCTHAFVCEARDDLQSPADLYLEGSDQHRGWFHSSLLESCGTRGHAPYKSVLTHGFVLDEKGYKMSKSLGNVVDPHEILKTYGADILRLWAITSDYSQDVKIGEALLKNTSDLYRRFRNTFRFLLGALEGLTKEELVAESDYAKMPELERYVLDQLSRLNTKIDEAIAVHDYNEMIHLLHHFCNLELSSFYFDIRKDRLYCDRPDLFERRATRTVMARLFEYLTHKLATVMPFTTEEAWSYKPEGVFKDSDSIHLNDFMNVPEDWRDEALSVRWDGVKQVRASVLAAIEPKRTDKTIGSSLEAYPHITLPEQLAKLLEGIDFAEVCITSQALVKSGPAEEIKVIIEKAEGNKCVRCWKVLPEVGTDPDYPDLSLRDADAVRYYQSEKKAA